MKKILYVSLMLLVILALTGCAPEKEKAASGTDASVKTEARLKAGLVVTGPANDGGWNEAALTGLQALEKELGFEIAYTDNIKQSDDESIIRGYAQQGFNLIIGHGWEYGEALQKVAADYPDLYFAQIGGDSGGSLPNLTSGVFRGGELSYLLGKLAAKMTKTNRTAFIGAMEIPTLVEEVETFRYTVPYINPAAKVDVVYTGTWTDVAKAKSTAEVLIDKGADVLIGINNNCDAGIIQAIEESGKDVMFLGWSGDWNKVSPDIVLTSGVQSVKNLLLIIGKMVKDDAFVAETVVYGVPENVQLLGTWSDRVPPEIRAEIEADWKKMNTGELKPEELKKLIGR